MMNLGIPQIVVIVMYCLNIGINLVKDGEKRETNYSFISSVIATILAVIVLGAGGFFS